mmetsp:Transcript_95056/g.264116  ORF Transcript_95056/g.264116 Transcript_95056/m.264116 type:complete len:219 (-) Transcript_95056:64-720(-)
MADAVKVSIDAAREDLKQRVMARARSDPEWVARAKESVSKTREYEAERAAAIKEWEAEVMAARTVPEMEKRLAEGPPRTERWNSWSAQDGDDERVQAAAAAALRTTEGLKRVKFAQNLPMMAILNHVVAARHTCFREAFAANTCDNLRAKTGASAESCEESRMQFGVCSARLWRRLQGECGGPLTKLQSCLEGKGSVNVLDCADDLLSFDRCTEDYTP